MYMFFGYFVAVKMCFYFYERIGYMEYIIHYDIAALGVCLTLIVHFISKKSLRTVQSKIFLNLMWCSLFSNVLDIITVVIFKLDTPIWLGYIFNMMYLVMFNTIPFIYHIYFNAAMHVISKRNKKIFIINVIPLLVAYTLILTNVFTNLMFSYDEQGYRHNSYFVILYVIAFWYMAMTFRFSIKQREMLTKGQLLSVCFYNIFCLIAIVVQAFYSNMLLLHFVVAVSLMLAYLTFENPKNYEDSIGIYNRSALMNRVSTAIEEKTEFSIIGMNLVGFDAVRDTIGVENGELLLKHIAEDTLPMIRPMKMFNVSQAKFVLLADDKYMDLDNVIEKIQGYYSKPIKFKEMEINLGVYMYQLDYPGDVQTMENVMDIIDYSSEVADINTNDVTMHASEEILWKKRREIKITQILQQAIKNNLFEVYYQPIYSVHDGCYRSAEALIRLFDDEMGFISPEEFIPMAERNGMILDIGEFVFTEVCQMMARERLWEKGIDYIEINLSVVQCMQESLYEKMISIIEKYELPYECVNLEITETAAVVSKETLLHNMEQLIKYGVTFALDDYGTGYSNISNIIKYPFRLIKLDKSMVWSAMDDEKAIRVLRHTVAMLKDLNLYIVAEGVENEKQAKELAEMGCGYLQGYYYSKPVPANVFLENIKEKLS